MNRLAALLISFFFCQLALANLVTEQSFDALGHKTNQTDAAGISTQFEYDALGHLTAVIDAQNHRTAYSYDEAGNKIAQTDANGHTTRWTYDAMGRVTTHTLPMNQTERFAYDAGGNVQTHVDFNGNATTFSYDINNRVTQKTYADGSGESFTYTPTGQIQTASRWLSGAEAGTASYSYDAMDRLVSETKPGGEQLSYSYDAAGNKIQTVTTLGNVAHTVTNTYDELNRLASTTDANGTTQYTYDSVGNQQSVTYANGLSQHYAYDANNRLTELTTQQNGVVTERLSYTLHPTGRRLSLSEQATGRYTQWQYDNLYRLTSESINAGNDSYSASYAYDATGNRTSESENGVTKNYTYDANDRLTQAGSVAYQYDNNGNTLSETDNSAAKTYAYNAKDELTTFAQNGNSTAFDYDVDGIRSVKTENGITTKYITDKNRDYAQVVAETQNGTTTATYTYGLDLISQKQAAGASYYLYDALGSVKALSDVTGAVTDTYNYTAFGVELNKTGTTENAYKFAGEQYDSATDNYYLRARYYNQNIGRFTQRDSWNGNSQDPITLHKYLYANSDGVNGKDPSGYYTQDFGYLVEKEVETQYESSHKPCVCYYGSRQYFDYASYLKPDIVNLGAKTFNEVKPLSPSGIAKGIAQLGVYTAVYGRDPFNWNPDTGWTPEPARVDGDMTYFVNLSGIIFYTDDKSLQEDFAVATLSTAAVTLRSKAVRVATRLGVDAVLQAAINNGIRVNIAANSARYEGSFGLAFLLF